MIKSLFFILVIFLLRSNLFAQIKGGEKPFSMDGQKNTLLQTMHTLPQPISYLNILSSNVPQIALKPVDITTLQQEDKKKAAAGLDLGVCRIGALIPADIRYPGSGNLVTLPTGEKIWFLQIKVSGAAALGFYYDQFHLPAGVRLFLFNKNGKQVLGSYSSKNNSPDQFFATEKVQGDLVNLELDMDAKVDPDQILFHINNVVQFYKAIDYLEVYKTTDNDEQADNLFKYDQSSPCEINAICSNDSIQRDATVHIEYVANRFDFAASGTMMNNTSLDGTPYMLTASHVDATNSTSSTTFKSWIFYFNYQTPTCIYTGSQPSTSQTIVGGTFVARSSYDSSTGKIAGDFLLLKLIDTIPSSYGAYLSGWDRSTLTPSGTCFSFHHPSADVKKVSTSDNVAADGNFNGGQANSHWQVTYTGNTGGIEEGSSGGGLFDPSGYFVGDLSGGAINNPSCTAKNGLGEEITNLTEYSKLSNDWLYTFQTPSTPASRLKDWLDPQNTGVTSLGPIPTFPYTPVVDSPSTGSLTSEVKLFPNPTSGILVFELNSPVLLNIKIDVFSIIGSKVSEFLLNQIKSGEFQIDLRENASGIYVFRISSGNETVTREVMLSGRLQ